MTNNVDQRQKVNDSRSRSIGGVRDLSADLNNDKHNKSRNDLNIEMQRSREKSNGSVS